MRKRVITDDVMTASYRSPYPDPSVIRNGSAISVVYYNGNKIVSVPLTMTEPQVRKLAWMLIDTLEQG